MGSVAWCLAGSLNKKAFCKQLQKRSLQLCEHLIRIHIKGFLATYATTLLEDGRLGSPRFSP